MSFPPPDVLERQRRLLKAASDQAHAASVKVEPIARIDGAFDRGIVRAAVEHRVDLIVVGWKGYATYREHFFGSMTDLVAKRSPVPVLVTRLTHPVQNTRRVILAFSDWNVAGAIIEQEVALCARIAEQLKATLTIAHALRYSRLSARLEPVLERSGAALVEEEGSLEHLLEGLLQPEDLLVLSTPVAVGFGSVTAGQVERLASRFERCSLVVMCHPASR